MNFLTKNKLKICNFLLFIWLLVFAVLFIAVNKPTDDSHLTSIQTIYAVVSFILIIGGVITSLFKPKWATGIALFILGFNFLLTGAQGLTKIGLALDGTFAYFLLPLCFLIVISFVDEPKLDMIRTIGICVFALFLIYIVVSSYASWLDVKKAADNALEEGHSYSHIINGHTINVDKENYNQAMKPIRDSLAYYFFNLLVLVNLIISTILIKIEKTN